MDKRVLTAIILSAAILFLYPYILNRYISPRLAKVAPNAVTAPSAPVSPQAPGAAGLQGAVRAQPESAGIKEELTTVETPLFKAIFTNMGGGIKSFELKKYRDTLAKNSPVVNLSGIVNKGTAFKTQIDVNGFKEDVIFQPSKTNIVIRDNEKAELLFTGATKEGIRVEKKFLFTGLSYMIGAETNLVNSSSQPFNGKAEENLSAGFAGNDKTRYHAGPLIYTKNKLFRQSLKEFQASGDGSLKWLGVENKYFLCAIIPKAGPAFSWVSSVPSETDSSVTLEAPVSLSPGAMTSFSYNAFAGPKEYDLLLKQNLGLEEAIQFGIFSFMAKPFLVVLNFFERYLGNYGIAIIILTVIIKGIFYPLTKHSLKSMKQMQTIQPQMAAIKEKYKDNKEKLNKELMELYKRYKINPLGGCLPMVLQIPVFIALYEVLYVAIELRQSPFFCWIKDLSDKDPYYISPLIMGATMFLQQRMTPSTMDPAQAKMMLFMPIVFTYMFLNFPAGLVIYWLVNNLLSIAQQYYIQRAPAKA